MAMPERPAMDQHRPLRVIMMGTPDFAVKTLLAVHAAGHEIVAVYSRAPAPAGRGMALRLSPVHKAAEELGLPVFTPTTLRNEEEAARFAAFKADVAVVVAYGMILPKSILDAPRLACLNLHASLLPRWRGAAPIQRAIMSGDRETGVAVMRMAEGLDTGPVGLVETVSIGPDMTAGQLHDELATCGAQLMVKALDALGQGELSFTEQAEEGVLYAKKISNDDSRIDWTQSSQHVHDLIRGLSPFPGAFAQYDFGKGPERVKILTAQRVEGQGEAGALLDRHLTVACGEGAIRILSLQRAGSKPLAAEDFLRGLPLAPPQRFM
jgi:methionyl-tRNA formyltransferase